MFVVEVFRRTDKKNQTDTDIYRTERWPPAGCNVVTSSTLRAERTRFCED